jgi:hypothetical protein
MQVEMRAGRTLIASGNPAPIRCDDGGNTVIQLSGKYAEPALRNRQFFAYCGPNAMSLPATTNIGLQLWNPPTSGVNLVLGKWAVINVATSATCTGYTLGTNTQLTLATSTAASATGPCLVGGGKSVATACATCTATAAATVVWLLAHNTADIRATGADLLAGDLDGMFVISPGVLVSINALGAAAAASSTYSYLTWEERPTTF